ncbi:MAG: hypothetical protein ACR2QK_16225 [Acidimicrobiales bacterium]
MAGRVSGVDRDRFRRWAAIVVVVCGALWLASCGGGEKSSTSKPSTSSSIGTTTEQPTTTAGDPTTTTTSGPTTTVLPGEEIDGFPQAGATLVVMGVAHDDVLNVRAAPGTDQLVVATAEPTADDLVATGRARQLPSSIWYEVTVGGESGWVGSRFVAFLGGTDDFTAEFLDGEQAPLAETMIDLGELVADRVATDDPESSVVQSVVGTVGDLGEITYDVIGIGDDAVAGYRLHIFAVEDEGGEAFVLRTIERTTFCSRGLSGELCA